MKEEPTLVEYKTFVQHLYQGDVSDITIYDGPGEVEITYRKSGILFAADGPYGLRKDPLLHSQLEKEGLRFTIMKEAYEPGAGSEYWFPLGGFVFTALPAVLTAVVIIQALVIKRLVAKKIPD